MLSLFIGLFYLVIKLSANEVFYKNRLNRFDLVKLLNIIAILTRSLLSAKLGAVQEKGIVLDNAIEELENLEDGKLIVGIFSINNQVAFIVQNSIRQNIEPLHVLKKKGFSTKGQKRGMGLSIMEELIVLESNLLMETLITKDFFVQKMIVTGGYR